MDRQKDNETGKIIDFEKASAQIKTKEIIREYNELKEKLIEVCVDDTSGMHEFDWWTAPPTIEEDNYDRKDGVETWIDIHGNRAYLAKNGQFYYDYFVAKSSSEEYEKAHRFHVIQGKRKIKK